MKLSRRSFLKVSSLGISGILTGTALAMPRSARTVLPIRRAAFTMGSMVTITAYCEDPRLAEIAIREAFDEMKTIDRLMSVFNEHSQISQVNLHGFERDIPVDIRIVELLESAERYSILTGGCFDVTIEPLMRLYGFRDETSLRGFPTDKQIADILEGVNPKNVSVNRRLCTVRLNHASTNLDPGGIAVGYALDRAAQILRNRGVSSALLNHSGDLYALGHPPESPAWEIRIVDPRNTSTTFFRTAISDQALSTSGNYENYVQPQGKTIGHLLNPKTGKTADSLLSGTVIARTAMETDALSTGIFVGGISSAQSVISLVPGFRFIGMTADAQTVDLS